jgi:hypothetical protein
VQQVIDHALLSIIPLELIYCSASDKAIVDNKAKVTKEQLSVFLNICWTKYVKAKIEPGWSFFSRRFSALKLTPAKDQPLGLLGLNQSANRGLR